MRYAQVKLEDWAGFPLTTLSIWNKYKDVRSFIIVPLQVYTYIVKTITFETTPKKENHPHNHHYIKTTKLSREFSLPGLVPATSVSSLFLLVGCSLRSPLTMAGSQGWIWRVTVGCCYPAQRTVMSGQEQMSYVTEI